MPAFFQTVNRTTAGVHLNPRTDSVARAASSDQHQADPVITGRRVVAENSRWAVLVADDHIKISVVVQVADRQAVAQVAALEVAACAPA